MSNGAGANMNRHEYRARSARIARVVRRAGRPCGSCALWLQASRYLRVEQNRPMSGANTSGPLLCAIHPKRPQRCRDFSATGSPPRGWGQNGFQITARCFSVHCAAGRYSDHCLSVRWCEWIPRFRMCGDASRNYSQLLAWAQQRQIVILIWSAYSPTPCGWDGASNNRSGGVSWAQMSAESEEAFGSTSRGAFSIRIGN
jgi:hypothetical protein